MDSYPLQWPQGFKRTNYVARKDWQGYAKHWNGGDRMISVGRSRDQLLHAIVQLGGTDPILSTNAKVRTNGMPLASELEKRQDDPGVAVYFRQGNQDRVMACDSYTTINGNLRALFHTDEALRSIQRHGAGDLLDRAFTGFTALPPAPAASVGRSWWDVLCLSRDASAEVVAEAYKVASLKYHPDRPGGDHAAMAVVNAAYQAFRKERGL